MTWLEILFALGLIVVIVGLIMVGRYNENLLQRNDQWLAHFHENYMPRAETGVIIDNMLSDIAERVAQYATVQDARDYVLSLLPPEQEEEKV